MELSWSLWRRFGERFGRQRDPAGTLKSSFCPPSGLKRFEKVLPEGVPERGRKRSRKWIQQMIDFERLSPRESCSCLSPVQILSNRPLSEVDYTNAPRLSRHVEPSPSSLISQQDFRDHPKYMFSTTLTRILLRLPAGATQTPQIPAESPLRIRPTRRSNGCPLRARVPRGKCWP